MQNVACPITIVHSDSGSPLNVKNEFSAMPVMMPGSAIGRTNRNETESRPKNRKRAIAKAAADPSRRAAPVATSATRTESHTALRTSCASQANTTKR